MNVLFLCTGNSCRSQMAEGWARHFGDDWLQVESAGIEMHGMNPPAIQVMRGAGVDISLQESTRQTDQMLGWADYLVTVCGHADENCPMRPAELRKEHWPLDDPARATGSDENIIAVFRESHDDIRRRVEGLIGRLKKDDGKGNNE
jgi:arsenate reductase